MPRARTKHKTKVKSGVPPFVVFISHSSHDSWVAEQIGKGIEAVGATKRLDKHFLKGGDDVRETILKEIRESTEVIVLLSPESQQSHWVSYEIGAAHSRGKRVTPILHNLRAEDMGPLLQGFKAIYLNDFDDFLIELKQRINNLNKWVDRTR
jgi:hypothetical protein